MSWPRWVVVTTLAPLSARLSSSTAARAEPVSGSVPPAGSSMIARVPSSARRSISISSRSLAE